MKLLNSDGGLRVFKGLDLNFFEINNIRKTIHDIYGMSKKIEYIDKRSDKVFIDSQTEINYAVSDSVRQEFNEIMALVDVRERVFNTMVRIPEVVVKFNLSPLGGYGMVGYGMRN